MYSIKIIYIFASNSEKTIMVQFVLRFVKVFILWTLYGMVSKVLFMSVNHSLYAETGVGDWMDVLWHGLQLDVAVAGYLTILPALLLICSLWYRGRVMRWLWIGYSALAALLSALAYTLNTGLYGYWGFPLDTTPLFYFTSSPADAMASMEWWMMVVAVVAIAVLTIGMFLPMKAMLQRICDDGGGRTKRMPREQGLRQAIAGTSVGVVLAAVLIIPIRGGFTVAANNVGTVYFSENIRLNHAAVNPLFSFLESATHNEDFASQYRFMDDAEAMALFSKMTYTARRDTTDNVITERPEHVVIVVLESFSRLIMDIPNVTPQLNKLCGEGLYFTNFHANSFRTDRGLVSILSGYPAQPTMSLMKYPAKTNQLYSIARSLGKAGYDTRYVYGGDANFTNMRSYLMATGFNRIVSEEDYDAGLRTGKWGVNDEELFKRALQEMDMKRPSLSVIQTSSSHEPYDVPMHVLDDERLNAFHYTDHYLGDFVSKLRQRPEWAKTLLVVVPDHLGCYPKDIDNFQLYRYQIPMVMLGGVVRAPQHVDTMASQHDLAATLLGMMGIDHSEFTFSKDILDPRSPHFAFFTVPDAVGMVTEDNAVIYDNVSGKTMLNTGRRRGSNLRQAQAYLQKLYDDISRR